MWTIAATILGWLLSFFKRKQEAPAQEAVDVESKMAKDAANKPSDAAAIDRLRRGDA
jgi:hypothetical protein